MLETKEQYTFSLWLRVALTIFCLIFIVTYWHERGPENFLWLSDIALFQLVIASWLASSFLLSMATVGVLFFEIFWNADFFFKLIFDVHLFGWNATAYMFDKDIPVVIKILSLSLHLGLPLLMIYMLIKLGYHPRAWKAQAVVLLILLPVCYFFTDPLDNINWVFGMASLQSIMSGWLYLLLQMFLVPLVVYLPTHLVLSRVFKAKK